MSAELNGKTAILYTRVSTKDQKDFGNSLAAQRRMLESYCNFHRMEVAAHFEEDHSAKNFNRPEFQELKKYVKANKGRIDYLLVQKWDRFSRNIGAAISMIEYFRNIGVEVNCIDNWIDYSSPDHIVILSIYLSTPEAENSKIRERTIAGTRQCLKEGRYVSKQPIGYVSGRDSQNKTLMQPDKVLAPLIKSLFEDYASGTYTQKELIEKYRHTELKLAKSNLSKMLENPLYMGMVRVPAYKNEPEILVEGLHTPIITKDLFYIIQSIKKGKNRTKKKTRGKNKDFPLSALIVCPNCGSPMYGSTSNNGNAKKKKRYYNNYRCPSNCQGQSYKAEIVHKELSAEFAKIRPSKGIVALFNNIIKDELKKTQIDATATLKVIDSKIHEEEKNLQAVTKKYALDKIPEDVYLQITSSCNSELIDLKAERAKYTGIDKEIDKYLAFGTHLISNLDVYFEKSCAKKKKLNTMCGGCASSAIISPYCWADMSPMLPLEYIIIKYGSLMMECIKQKSIVLKFFTCSLNSRSLINNILPKSSPNSRSWVTISIHIVSVRSK